MDQFGEIAIEHDPNGGKHLWYRHDKPLPFKTYLHGSEESGHNAIELLGDRNLIVAPPSVSLRSGKPYRWVEGHSPDDIPLAPLPAFVAWAAEDAARACRPVRRPPPAALPRQDIPRQSLSWRDVEEAVPDFVALALKLGVRFASTSCNSAGWYACHSIYREDRHPSASFSQHGAYWESGLWQHTNKKALSIFDLAVERGVAGNFAEAVSWVAREIGYTDRRRKSRA
jgi:hypothetical protein